MLSVQCPQNKSIKLFMTVVFGQNARICNRRSRQLLRLPRMWMARNKKWKDRQNVVRPWNSLGPRTQKMWLGKSSRLRRPQLGLLEDKAEYAVTLVACGLAGVVIVKIRVEEQPRWSYVAFNKARAPVLRKLKSRTLLFAHEKDTKNQLITLKFDMTCGHLKVRLFRCVLASL